jgi:DNA-binding transcriptional ArsR family regulator
MTRASTVTRDELRRNRPALRSANGNSLATIWAAISLNALPGDPFDALGDPHRRAIVELLGTGDRSVRELADELPISRPAVSRHLKLLKEAGLVTDRAEGTRRLYRLHDEGIEAVQAYLQQVWGDAAARFKLLADN